MYVYELYAHKNNNAPISTDPTSLLNFLNVPFINKFECHLRNAAYEINGAAIPAVNCVRIWVDTIFLAIVILLYQVYNLIKQ